MNHWKEAFNDSYCTVMEESELYQAFNAAKRQIILYDIPSFKENFQEIVDKAKEFNISLFALTGAPSFHEGTQLLDQGVSGYGNSYMAAGNFQMAIEIIGLGDVWLYPEFIQQLIARAKVQPQSPVKDSSLDQLTPKELEVTELVALGMTNKEIAIQLAITERTIKAHLTHIYEKLNISDRLSLALIVKAS